MVNVLSDFGAKRYSKDTSLSNKKIPLGYPTRVKKIPFPQYKYLLFNVPCAREGARESGSLSELQIQSSTPESS